MYEPEQFPGLIYRMDEPKVVILVFSSGKLVCTVAKKVIQVHIAVNKLQETLEAKVLIRYEGLDKPRLPPLPTKPSYLACNYCLARIVLSAGVEGEACLDPHTESDLSPLEFPEAC